MLDSEVVSAYKTTPRWNTYTSVVIVTLVCIGLFGFGALVGGGFAPELRANLGYVGLALGLSFSLTGRLKWLRWATAPILIALSATGGLTVTLWVQPQAVGKGLAFVMADMVLVTLLARWHLSKLGRLSGLLGILGMLLSLAGFAVIALDGGAWIVLTWGIAAILCFSALLYNAMSLILSRLPHSAYLSGAVNVFLLCTGLLMNLLMLLQALPN